MTDRIHLRGVEAVGYHGVLPDEKRDGQPFVVDVVMQLDLATAGGSDALDDTVSYAEVAGEVMSRITGPSFDLIERLAEVIADDVLDLALVDAVTVTVHKPEAPVGHPFGRGRRGAPHPRNPGRPRPGRQPRRCAGQPRERGPSRRRSTRDAGPRGIAARRDRARRRT